MAGIPISEQVKFSDEDYKEVQYLAGLGLPVGLIARAVNVSKATFERRLHDDTRLHEALEKGRLNAGKDVAGKAHEMALSGEYPAMTIFWLKCRMGWREKDETPQAVIMPELVASVDNIQALIKAAEGED